MERLFIAVDFDGTITRRDTLHVIVETFGKRGLWDSIEPRLRSGEITIEQAMQEQFATVRADEGDVLELVLREAPVRPGFAELVDWARANDHPLAVFSNGFRRVIDAILGAAGVSGLPITSHDAEFTIDGTTLVWTDRGELCELCGRPCKRRELHERWDGQTLVYVGDGISDRCVAPLGDRIFARDGLARDLDEAGIPYTHFDDFYEVLGNLRGDVASAA